jgi:hypothetical protein
MIRRAPSRRPLIRVVYGGTLLGDLVVEIRNDGVTIRPKGRRRSVAGASLTWNRAYYAARGTALDVPIPPSQEAVKGKLVFRRCAKCDLRHDPALPCVRPA